MLKAAIRWFYSTDNPIAHDSTIDPDELIEKLVG